MQKNTDNESSVSKAIACAFSFVKNVKANSNKIFVKNVCYLQEINRVDIIQSALPSIDLGFSLLCAMGGNFLI